MQYVPLILAALGIVASLITTAAILTWWLSKQFSETRHTMYGALSSMKTQLEEKVEDATAQLRADLKEIDAKFDAHEKLDAQRFEQVNLGIMKIELREQSRGEMFGPSRIS